MKKSLLLLLGILAIITLVSCDLLPFVVIERFTVTYFNEEAIHYEEEVVKGAQLNLPTTPKKEDHTFQYWTIDGTKLDITMTVETNLTISAYFEKNETSIEIAEQDEYGFYYYQVTGSTFGGYYALAQDKVGEELKQVLHNILQNYNKVTYGDARYILEKSDLFTKDGETYVRGMYDHDKIATTWIGTGTGAWQREHVWPNSKLGISRVTNTSRNQGSDMHNLRAITGINQTRSNRYFEDATGSAKTIGTEAFYPGDEDKGDVARILLYMTVMYDFLTLTDDISKLINDASTNYTLAGAYMGKLDVLLQWHKDDPVDDFERSRNEFIYSGQAVRPDGASITPQGNRNPFIDHPELVHLIWENKTVGSLTKVSQESLIHVTVHNHLISMIDTRKYIVF